MQNKEAGKSPDIDGGYAWVVAFAAWMASAISSGKKKMFINT